MHTVLRRGDLIAGLTVWAVLGPESLAYASIAGVSPVVGLYAAPPRSSSYAIFGSSRHLIVGPMSVTAALSAAAVAPHYGLTPVLAIVTGIVALGAGLLRLGFLASFISEPVLKGFIVGSHSRSSPASSQSSSSSRRATATSSSSSGTCSANSATPARRPWSSDWPRSRRCWDSGGSRLSLAAVVIAAVIELVDVPALVRLYRVWTSRLGRIYGHAARPDFVGWVDLARGDAEKQPHVVVLRVEAGLFFANAEHIRRTVLAHARRDGVKAVVIDAETMPYIDVTAAEALAQLRDDLERDGVQLLLRARHRAGA